MAFIFYSVPVNKMSTRKAATESEECKNIDGNTYRCQYESMTTTSHPESIRRITANLPAELLEEAMKCTEKGITETLVAGLESLRRRRAYDLALALRGKVHLNVDLEESRERNRR